MAERTDLRPDDPPQTRWICEHPVLTALMSGSILLVVGLAEFPGERWVIFPPIALGGWTWWMYRPGGPGLAWNRRNHIRHPARTRPIGGTPDVADGITVALRTPAALKLIRATQGPSASDAVAAHAARRGRHYLWMPSTHTTNRDETVAAVLLIETDDASQARLDLALSRAALDGALDFTVLKPATARTVQLRLGAARPFR